MTPPVEIHPPAHRPIRRFVPARRVGLAAVAVAASFVALWLVSAVAFRDPDIVGRLRVDNPSGYDIHVEIAEPVGGGGRLALGVAGQRCTVEFADVVDPGPTWIVRFRTQGRDGGEVTVERSDLEQADWTLPVPTEVIDRFTAAGVPPAPRHSCAPE